MTFRIFSRSKKPWPAQHSAWAKSFESFCKTVFKIYCPLSVKGQENLPAGPYVICSNHASHLDSAMLMVATGLPFEKIGLIAAKDYFFDQPKRSFLHSLLNLVPIARGRGAQAVKDSIKACSAFLQSNGQVLIMYPEGTRSQNGAIAHFKEGAAILAHALNLPIVPALVVGSFESLPKGAFFPKSRNMCVRFAKPLNLADFIKPGFEDDRKALFSAYREASTELERRVRDLALQEHNHV
jgi:1-acyl-sn-glycerol-3-phosphate acyltransferase